MGEACRPSPDGCPLLLLASRTQGHGAAEDEGRPLQVECLGLRVLQSGLGCGPQRAARMSLLQTHIP